LTSYSYFCKIETLQAEGDAGGSDTEAQNAIYVFYGPLLEIAKEESRNES